MSDGDWKTFYEENPPPLGLLETKVELSNFCNYHAALGHKVVLITSGGTSVPLEHSTVRFVDNFSAGNRGAASAEYFLKSNCAVIFAHRSKTLEPFVRHLPVSDVFDSCAPSKTEDGVPSVTITGKICQQMIPLLNEYKKVQAEKRLLKLQFTTLSSYFHLLYVCAQAMRPLGRDAILYLAAAVSDFYIPQKDMSLHKISSDEPLTLTLRVVPKMLQPLVRHWVPDAFVVSFKLETDPSLLLKKSRASLQKYGHQLVIANELDSRREKVVFVAQDEETIVSLTKECLKKGKDIEEIIVRELLCRYADFQIA